MIQREVYYNLRRYLYLNLLYSVVLARARGHYRARSLTDDGLRRDLR